MLGRILLTLPRARIAQSQKYFPMDYVIVARRKRGRYPLVEKPGAHPLYQVIKVNLTTNDTSYPLRTQHQFCDIPAKDTLPGSNQDMTDKLKLRDSLLCKITELYFLKTVKAIRKSV